MKKHLVNCHPGDLTNLPGGSREDKLLGERKNRLLQLSLWMGLAMGRVKSARKNRMEFFPGCMKSSSDNVWSDSKLACFRPDLEIQQQHSFPRNVRVSVRQLE